MHLSLEQERVRKRLPRIQDVIRQILGDHMETQTQ